MDRLDGIGRVEAEMKANEIALSRLLAAEPVLTDVKPAGQVLKGLKKTDILHAGPPVAFEAMCCLLYTSRCV